MLYGLYQKYTSPGFFLLFPSQKADDPALKMLYSEDTHERTGIMVLVKGKPEMLQTDTLQYRQTVPQLDVYSSPPALVVQPDIKLYALLADLSPERPWGERKMAAKKLGYLRDPDAVPGLLDALPSDPFWMVRCAIIQALEMIGDRSVLPTLLEVAENDGFQVVRSHAAKAIQRLSQAG
jgi:hypothetical protein